MYNMLRRNVRNGVGLRDHDSAVRLGRRLRDDRRIQHFDLDSIAQGDLAGPHAAAEGGHQLLGVEGGRQRRLRLRAERPRYDALGLRGSEPKARR